MPVQVRTPDASDDSDKVIHTDLSNSFTRTAAEGFIAEIRSEQAKIEENNRIAQEANQPHVDQIKLIKKTAAMQGFTKSAFGKFLKKLDHLDKANKVEDALNDREKEIFGNIEAMFPEVTNIPELPLFGGA